MVFLPVVLLPVVNLLVYMVLLPVNALSFRMAIF
jgi:hypothetical protein